MRKEKTYLYFFELVLIIFTLGCTTTHSDSGKIYKIHANVNDSRIVYNFGEQELGNSLQLMLELENSLDTPFVINSVKSYCGCTMPDYSRDVIKPNAKAEVKIIFTPDHLGVNDKSVKVYLNIKDSPVELIIRGNVVKRDDNH